MVMKIRCTQCGSARFIFTHFNKNRHNFHGACCACCQKPLGLQDLLPDTRMDPVSQCLLDSYKTLRAPD